LEKTRAFDERMPRIVSFALLARVDPKKVRKAAPSADRLLNHLDEVL